MLDLEHPLGWYSKLQKISGFMFRTFKANAKYDWHPAPQPQYILYLEGQVEASGGGETYFFIWRYSICQ